VTANPFVALFERPVATLTAAAYALVLLSALVGSWYAGGRNALYLVEFWQETPGGQAWRLLVPLAYAARVVAMLLLLAVDLLLVAGIIHVLT